MKERITPVAFYILFFFIQSFCFSQKIASDSLFAALKIAKEDTTKVKIYNNLFLEFEFTDDEKAKYYLNQAFDLAQKFNYKKGLAYTYTYFGYFAEDKSNYPEALKNYLASLKIRESLHDKPGIADSYSYIGNIYSAQENYEEALKKYSISLEIYKALGSIENTAILQNNIGTIRFHQKNYTEALKNYFAALEIQTKLGNKKGTADSYGNIGNVYFTQGNTEEALKKYFEALKITEESGNKIFRAGIYANIGIALTKEKKYIEAEKYFNEAKNLSLEIGYKECLKNIYMGLTELDSAKEDYKEAYENHKQYIVYKDSLDNEETRKKTIQSQMTFDFDKKEAIANAEHKKELENQGLLADERDRKQKIILLFVVCGLLLVLCFSAFIFRSLHITNKQKDIIQQQKDLVEQQKQNVEAQKLMAEEKQKEIIDSITYARRIQRSLLPTEKYIEKNINRLRKNKL
jgi:tetratricopeptide (TPR) repeat protein